MGKKEKDPPGEIGAKQRLKRGEDDKTCCTERES